MPFDVKKNTAKIFICLSFLLHHLFECFFPNTFIGIFPSFQSIRYCVINLEVCSICDGDKTQTDRGLI